MINEHVSYSSMGTCNSLRHKSLDQQLLNTKYGHSDYIHDANNSHQPSYSIVSPVKLSLYTLQVYTHKVYVYLRSIVCKNMISTKQNKKRAMMKAVTCEFASNHDETQSKTLTGNAEPSIFSTIPYNKNNSGRRLGEQQLIRDDLLLLDFTLEELSS